MKLRLPLWVLWAALLGAALGLMMSVAWPWTLLAAAAVGISIGRLMVTIRKN